MKSIPSSALFQHIAFLGKTGSGKTSTAKLAVEQILRDSPTARVCVLDAIKSDWWGLTSSADGKKPGLPFYILGGPRGHVGLHSSAGKAIGELVATGALPLSIIDMADFEAGGLQEFFNAFAPALLKRMRGVVHLVVEEAHEFAPKERAGVGAENMAIYYAKKLATAGRSKGIRMLVVTQRTQALHNAVLGSCDTMVAHRLTAPADQEPVKKWLKANVDKATFEKVSTSLSSLKTGSAWLCSGEAQVSELIQFPKITTFDNSATPTGNDDLRDVKTAHVDEEKLRAIIGEAVKTEAANDPKALKAQIASLTADKTRLERSAAQAAPAIDSTALEDARRRGFKQGFDEAVNQASRQYDTMQRLFLSAISVMENAKAVAAHELTFAIAKNDTPSVSPTLPKVAAPTRAAPTTPKNAMRATTQPAASGGVDISGPQRKIIESISFWHEVGTDWPSREQVAAIAGYSAKSGSFRNTISSLNVAGLITGDRPGCLALTESGKSIPLDAIDATTRLRSILTGPEEKLIATLREAGSLTRQQVADGAGYSAESGSFRNTLSSLHVKDIIFYPDRERVSLTDWSRLVLP